MPTKTDIRRLLKKGLTGKEAARLILQDSWEVDNEREGFLSESDIQAIKGSLRTPEDIQDYNKWVEVYRLIDYSVIDAERAYLWVRGTIFEVYPEVMSFETAEQVRRLSFQLPTIVTAQQYEDIKAAQRQGHMEEMLSLWEVLDWLGDEGIVPAEIVQEWEQYETDSFDDEEAYAGIQEWLYSEKPAEYVAIYIPYLIPLIQDVKPVMLTAAEREEVDRAWESWRDSKKLGEYDIPKALQRRIYERRKARQKGAAGLLRQLERLGDGRLSMDEGETLLEHTYCLGQELYEAGIAPWIDYVDQFKTGHNEPARLYAILQEEGVLGGLHTDSRGYYDQAWHTQMLSHLSDLSMFQQLHADRDGEEPGSGLVAYLMGQYALIRARLKAFLAIHSVLEACSEITGIPFVEKLEDWYGHIESLVGFLNFALQRANLSGQNEYYEGPELKLPLLDIERLKPDPEHLQYMRERMAIALGPDWFRDTTLKLLEESSVLTAEELREIRDEQERRGQYQRSYYKSSSQEGAADD
jgi:hypothetical protein